MWMRMDRQDRHILHRDAALVKVQEGVQRRVYQKIRIRVEDPII
jgi:hypothetical protein